MRTDLLVVVGTTDEELLAQYFCCIRMWDPEVIYILQRLLVILASNVNSLCSLDLPAYATHALPKNLPTLPWVE